MLLSLTSCSNPVTTNQPKTTQTETIPQRDDLTPICETWRGAAVYYIHDDERCVGIWIYESYYGGGVSILPDSEYTSGE